MAPIQSMNTVVESLSGDKAVRTEELERATVDARPFKPFSASLYVALLPLIVVGADLLRNRGSGASVGDRLSHDRSPHQLVDDAAGGQLVLAELLSDHRHAVRFANHVGDDLPCDFRFVMHLLREIVCISRRRRCLLLTTCEKHGKNDESKEVVAMHVFHSAFLNAAVTRRSRSSYVIGGGTRRSPLRKNAGTPRTPTFRPAS